MERLLCAAFAAISLKMQSSHVAVIFLYVSNSWTQSVLIYLKDRECIKQYLNTAVEQIVSFFAENGMNDKSILHSLTVLSAIYHFRLI